MLLVVKLRWVSQLKGKIVSLRRGRLLCFNGTGRDASLWRGREPVVVRLSD